MDDSLPSILQILAGGLLGLISATLAGHFGFRSADRLPGETRWPQCVYCLRPLRWSELLPLFGWVMRAGGTSLPCSCGLRKGLWLQPAAEITGLILGALAVTFAGWSWAIVPLCFGLGLLPAMSVIDLSFGVIPDGLNILLAFFGLLWLEANDGVFMGLITAAGLLGISLLLAVGYSKLRGREMLGLGDVKFFAAAGLWLPIMQVPWFMAMSGMVGAVMGVLWQRAGGGKEFPFAPALCLTLAGCILYQLYSPF